MIEQPTLFTVENGIDSKVTNLFLRADPETRVHIVNAIDVVGSYTPDDTVLADGSPLAMWEDMHAVLGDQLAEDFYMRQCISALCQYPRDVLQRVHEDFLAVLSGERELTPYERKAMSNLSSEGRSAYEAALGIDIMNLQGPVLEIGTGKHATFVKDLLSVRPDLQVVSTSVHLGQKVSPMRDGLAGKDDRGVFAAAEGAKLPFVGEKFKTVISLNAAPFYADYDEVVGLIAETYRVLVAGGIGLLCPAVCDGGKRELRLTDLPPEAELRMIPEAGRHIYDPAIDRMIVVNKAA